MHSFLTTISQFLAKRKNEVRNCSLGFTGFVNVMFINSFTLSLITDYVSCRKAFDKKPEELDIYCPGESPKSKLLCDLCVDDEQTAQVYCPACPKKMCKTHEKVNSHIVVKLMIKSPIIHDNH